MNAPCRRRAIWAAQSVSNAKEISHETKVEAREDAKTEADVIPYMCPKCNREYRRGMYFHKKYCKGL